MRRSVRINSGLVEKPVAIGSTNRPLPVGFVAVHLLVFLSFLTLAAPVSGDEQINSDGALRRGGEEGAQNGSYPPTGVPGADLRNKGGLRQDVPDSLPSCCSWASVAAFLAGSKGRGSHTMAETLYTLSTEDALRVAADASTAEKNYLQQPTSSQKRKGLMEAKKNLQRAYDDLRVEMEAMAKDDVPGKAELLANMKNALDVIQRHLSVHQRILSGKTASPALLRDIGLLDRLLARISADCREYLAGG